MDEEPAADVDDEAHVVWPSHRQPQAPQKVLPCLPNNDDEENHDVKVSTEKPDTIWPSNQAHRPTNSKRIGMGNEEMDMKEEAHNR